MPEFLRSDIWFWFIIILFLASRGVDIYTSLDFQEYGQNEGNSWMQNKFGYVSWTKQTIVIIACCAGAIFIQYGLPLFGVHGENGYGWIVLLIVTVGSFWIGLSGFRKKRASRNQQNIYLDAVRDNIPVKSGIATVNFLVNKHCKNEYIERTFWFWLYGWIRETAKDDSQEERDRVTNLVGERIWDVAQLPPSQRFPK